MADSTSSSSLLSSASSSGSLSTSTATSASSTTTSLSPSLPISISTSDLSSPATTATVSTTETTVTSATTTGLTDTAISSSTSDTTSSIITITSTSTSLPTLTTPTTTSQSTSTTVAAGGPVAITTTVLFSSSAQTPTRTAAPSSSNSFFENKGAVAGVFTVVGLIVLGLLIIFIFVIIRRRRAKQFDREVEAAAAEAAAAPAPHFLDDDDDDPYRSPSDQPTSYIDHPQYSSDISSHGTYSQPALASQEAYGMRDLGPAPGELYNNAYASGGTAGAAGVGVARARSTRDPGAFASGFQDGATPYPAFAGPAAFHSGAYGNGAGYNSVGPGVGAGVGAGMQRGMSLNHHPNADHATNDQDYSQGLHPGQYVQQSDLARNPSQVTYGTTHASSTLVGSSASPTLPKEQPPYAVNYASAPVQDAGEGAYGGYTDDLGGGGHKLEDRQSYLDDDEDEGRPKILKVANE